MPIDPQSISAVSVDSYGTVVDVGATKCALAEHVDDVDSIARMWRERSLTYALVSNIIDAYEPFYELNRYALEYALAAHDVELSADRIEEILSVYHELDVFEDVRGGLEAVRSAGYEVYVLSNGDPEMLDSMVEHAGIDDIVTDAISANDVRRYKPAPELYRHAADEMGTPIDEVVHVSAGWLDVQGAKHAGMDGVWMNRTGAPWDPFDGDPDLTAGSFHEFADSFVDGQ